MRRPSIDSRNFSKKARIALLQVNAVGRIAVIYDGRPFVFSVNYGSSRWGTLRSA